MGVVSFLGKNMRLRITHACSYKLITGVVCSQWLEHILKEGSFQTEGGPVEGGFQVEGSLRG